MSNIPDDQLIEPKKASQILGFKTNQQVTKYINEGILKTYEKQGSKRKWLDIEESIQTAETFANTSTRPLLPNP